MWDYSPGLLPTLFYCLCVQPVSYNIYGRSELSDFDGEINSTALFTAAPHAFRYVLLTMRFHKITYAKVHNALFQFTKVTAASPCITQVYQTRITPDSIVLTPGESRNALGLIAVYPRPDERRLSLHDIL